MNERKTQEERLNMTHEEQRIWLIREQQKEETELSHYSIPKDEQGQKDLLRGLMNIWAPKTLGEEFLRIQDEYLTEENRLKGITKLADLPRKILVIGSPGAGKSTFSRKLRDKTGLPLYYLDMIFHNPDRTTVSRGDFDGKLSEILNTNEWIIDGNYQRTLPLRFKNCTEVFFFDLPVDECLRGAEARIGQKREDMPWIEEEFDSEFRQYILDFSKDQLPRIYQLIELYADTKKIVVFYSRQEADAWLEI